MSRDDAEVLKQASFLSWRTSLRSRIRRQAVEGGLAQRNNVEAADHASS